MERAPKETKSETSGGSGGRRAAPQSPNEALQPEAAPPPPQSRPRKRRPMLSAASGFLTFLLIAALATGVGFVWGRQRVNEPGPLPADKVLYIAPGTDVPEIIDMLGREKIIDSGLLLNVVLLVERNRSKLRAGEYLFKQSMSLREVVDVLVTGKQVLHAITIPEGLTSEQIAERLRASDVLVGEIIEVPKEGSILPETYKVARGTTRADLLKKMQLDQARIVDQIWARRTTDLPLRSPYELVTLASIVEKETGKADERPRVAGVFINRLQKRMRLQSDPTIVYGLVGGKGTLGRGITRAELGKPTPYNTYVVDGLPPGPIANPGRAALDAVANPSRTKDLYFVADGTGGHVFAETLDQHARNVQRWRQIEKEARDRQDAPATDVDRSEPQLLAPGGAPRDDRRGAIEKPKSVYGSLPKSFGMDQPSSLSAFPAAAAIDQAVPASKPGGLISANAFTMGPGLDELGLTVRGVGEPVPSRAGIVRLDGPSDSLNEMPAPEKAELAAANEQDLSGSSYETAGTRPRARSVDASEGTPFDPLLDKTYDLNSPKTVPVLK
jgi:UPF0755 protein